MYICIRMCRQVVVQSMITELQTILIYLRSEYPEKRQSKTQDNSEMRKKSVMNPMTHLAL